MRALFLLLLLLTLPVCAEPALQAAFDLGNQLSLAVLGRAGGADAKTVADLMKKAETSAKTLKVTIPPQPKDPANGLKYLLEDVGPLVKKLNPRQAMAFEVAMKTNILRLMYTPGNDNGIVKQLQAQTTRAGLHDMTGPLLKAVESKASSAQFGALIEAFQANVRAQL